MESGVSKSYDNEYPRVLYVHKFIAEDGFNLLNLIHQRGSEEEVHYTEGVGVHLTEMRRSGLLRVKQEFLNTPYSRLVLRLKTMCIYSAWETLWTRRPRPRDAPKAGTNLTYG